MPRRRKDGTTKRIQWDKLRVDYVSSFTNIRDLAKKYDVGYSYVTLMSRREGWVKQRKQFQKKIANKTETKLVNQGVKEWSKQLKLYSKIDRQISKVLKKYEDPDNPNKTINVQDLKALAATLNDSVKGQKLIKGEPTGDETHISFHMKTVQFIKEREKEVEKQNEVIDVDGKPG